MPVKLTRSAVVGVAVVLGLVAAALSYYFLHGAQSRAFNNAKLVQAYVVAKPMPLGLAASVAVSSGYLREVSIPNETRPETAITNLAVLNGKQAMSSYPVGQVLVDGMFVTPAQAASTFSHRIPADEVAVTVSVDQVHGVAGLPVPGDHVDILVNVGGTESFMLQNVPILAIGQQTVGGSATTAASGTGSASSGSSNTSSSGLFTFAATPQNAERIALAQDQNLGIYLLLTPPSNPVVSVPPSNAGNVLSGPPS